MLHSCASIVIKSNWPMSVQSSPSGAMYKLNTESVNGTLTKNSTGSVQPPTDLKVCSIGDISKDTAKYLVKIN